MRIQTQILNMLLKKQKIKKLEKPMISLSVKYAISVVPGKVD